jgi:hypothetical protein
MGGLASVPLWPVRSGLALPLSRILSSLSLILALARLRLPLGGLTLTPLTLALAALRLVGLPLAPIPWVRARTGPALLLAGAALPLAKPSLAGSLARAALPLAPATLRLAGSRSLSLPALRLAGASSVPCLPGVLAALAGGAPSMPLRRPRRNDRARPVGDSIHRGAQRAFQQGATQRQQDHNGESERQVLSRSLPGLAALELPARPRPPHCGSLRACPFSESAQTFLLYGRIS